MPGIEIAYILIFAGLIVAMRLYFLIADRFNIIDKPNHRSSHQTITIRGGGIIFPVACLASLLVQVYPGWIVYSTGLLLISIISFWDDIANLNSRIRLLIQSLSVILLLSVFRENTEWYYLAIAFFVIIGVINVYNFMDGINGITALYSITVLTTLFWISENILQLKPQAFFIIIIFSLLVFSFFNFRKKARCFAGDVGSISIAFVICALLLELILATGSVIWILLLGVYGMDALFTIICRLFRKEPLLEAHRSHFYQYLANERKISHLYISFIYAMTQVVINLAVIKSYTDGNSLYALMVLFVFLLIYVTFRIHFEGKHRLFTTY